MVDAEEQVKASNMFLAGGDLDNAIREIAKAKKPRCAVAFLGNNAATIFKGGKAQIICNLASGGTNPAAVKELQKQGHKVRQNDRLHAKIYIGGGKSLVVSANLSANGLGLQDTEEAHWIEAGVHTDDVEGATSWFEKPWNDEPRTREISDIDLQAATNLWKTRRSNKPTVPFLDFDVHAADVPLVVWWCRNTDYKKNPSIGKRGPVSDRLRKTTGSTTTILSKLIQTSTFWRLATGSFGGR